MTIGVDIRVLMDARWSGVAEYAYNLLQALAEQDTANTYVLFYNSVKTMALPPFKFNHYEIVSRRVPNKILNYFNFTFLNYPKLDKFVNKKLDVWLMPHLHFMAWPSAKNILTVHDLSFLRYPEFFSFRQNFWHRMIRIKKLINHADLIIAISENTKRDIIALTGANPEKIKVIYSGVNSAFRPLLPSETFRIKQKYSLPDRFILALGTIEPRKNLVNLIKAFNILKANSALADARLILAGGNGWKFREVYREAKQSSCAADIKFLNYIPAEDKPALYNLASVCAFPSLYEGFGFPPLEAMACGTPLVASYASSVPEVVDEAGILVNPASPADLALALAQVLLNSDLSLKLANLGLKQAEKFSWKKTAEEYLKIFN